jgi:N-acetylglutamate synthase-like GNAT family acetyltransferase
LRKTGPAISIRRAVSSDIPQLLDLLWLVSDRPYPLEAVRRTLADLAPGEYFGWVALAEDEFVGLTMLEPCTLVASGKQCVACYWTNLCVRPDYRRTALYPRLVFTMVGGAAELGMDLVYGAIRRPEVAQGHLSLGLQRIGEMPVMAKPIRPARLLSKHRDFGNAIVQFSAVPDYVYGQYRSLRRASGRDGYVFKNTLASECDPDSVIHALRAGCGSEVRRPLTAKAFLKRYHWNPDGDAYRILSVEHSGMTRAAIVYRAAVRGRDIRATVIMEMGHLPSEEHALRLSLFELERIGEESKCEVILCLSSSLAMQALLRSAGYMESNENYVLMMKSTGRKTDCVFPATIAGWYFTFADHDAF